MLIVEKLEKLKYFSLKNGFPDLNEILIFRRNSCLRALILNPNRIQVSLEVVGVGEKSWKTLRVERSG